jgi:hypothetical protein
MSTSIYLRQTILAILILTFTSAFAQTNTEKIKAKWNIDRFEVEKNTPQTIKAKQDLQGICLTFGNDELVISKKTDTGYDVIKRGPYFVSGNSLTIGKDQANILSLSEKNLTIKISGQGVLYLTKM